jgi:hypothetical protein
VALPIALVLVLALGAVVANLALLRSTEDASEPVGRLSPRAVFADATRAPGVPITQTGTNLGTTPEREPDD